MEESITHILRNSRRNVKVIHIPSLKVLGNGLCDCALWPTSVVFVFLGATWATALRRNTQKEKDEKANNTAHLPACVQVLWRRGRQPDVREPACLKSTSEDMRSWRIASRGHELHSYPHKDEPCVFERLFENRQRARCQSVMKRRRAGAIKRLLISERLQSEMIFCSIMDSEEGK